MAQKWRNVRNIGIDEIALLKGHKNFVIVIIDLDTGDLLDILEGRNKTLLINFFRSKGAEFCRQIQNFVSDFWKGYHNVALEVFENVTVTGDRFHAYSQLQDCIDTFRKALRRAEETKDLDVLKRAKYILLKNEKNLTDKQREQLAEMRKEPLLNDLMAAYDIKNEFRAIYEQKVTVERAKELVTKWKANVGTLKHEYLKPFITFLTKWEEPILNYFKHRHTTGKVEGTNNKLKMIKRQAFGFRNFDNFRIKCLIECNS